MSRHIVNITNAAHTRILRYFTYTHLPLELQAISEPFHTLAHTMAETLQGNSDEAEVTVGLRKLLEAKDCFVRARL